MKLRNMTSIYLLDGDNILLLYRIGSRAISDSYIGSSGGHFENDELNDPKACVLRELKEELDLSLEDIDNLELRYITLRGKDDEIRQNYYYFAELKNKSKKLISNEGNLKWFKLNEIHDLNMPHTALYVTRHYVASGRFNHKLYAGIADINGVKFTELDSF